MALDFDGSADFAVSLPNVQVGNGTIAGWINADALPASTDRDVICTFFRSIETEQFTTHDKQLYLNSAGILKARIYDGGVKTVASTSAVSTGTWHHVAMTIDGTNFRVWLDGANEGSMSAGASYTGYDTPKFAICGLPAALDDGESTRTRLNGKIAEFCIWDAALTTGEMGALASGAAPVMVRPSSIVGYWPLMLGGERPIGGADELTLTSSPPKSNHPRIIMPSAQVLQFPQPAAPTGRVMSSLAKNGGLAGKGGIAGKGGGLAG